MTINKLSTEEIIKHSKADDCWLVIDGKVWDVTEFSPKHPGGPGIIHKYAGRDATSAYSEVHAPSVISDELDQSKCKGVLDESTITEEWAKQPPEATQELTHGENPPLTTIINAYDFEEVASRTLSPKTWAFYSSAATDCITRDANSAMFDRIWFRPRLMRDVRQVSTRSKILGCDVDFPLFISPAALAKLVHPDGEKAMARGCVAKSTIQCVSSNASFPLAEIVAETPPTHPTFFQLYVNADRAKTRSFLDSVLKQRPRVRAIFITIDAPTTGKREADERIKADESVTAANNSGVTAKNDSKGGGIGRLTGSYIDRGLVWEDLVWIRKQVGPDMPLVIKGIQCAADAKMAMNAGMQGILVSNHGGRCLDSSPPAILTLLELHKCCPEVFDRMEVFVDGGIRRGTDILKCVCLGATAVGIGRHFLYALNYGQDGVEHLFDIMKDELEVAMQLVGITSLSQAHPGLVNTLDVDCLVPDQIEGHPYAHRAIKARL